MELTTRRNIMGWCFYSITNLQTASQLAQSSAPPNLMDVTSLVLLENSTYIQMSRASAAGEGLVGH
jgi:hypothetical protein